MGDELASGKLRSTSISSRLTASGLADRKSTLTLPLLTEYDEEYEVVKRVDHTEMILQCNNTSGVTDGEIYSCGSNTNSLCMSYNITLGDDGLQLPLSLKVKR